MPADGFKVDRDVVQRAKTFFLERRFNQLQTTTEFLELIHEFELYLRDAEMFEHAKRRTGFSIDFDSDGNEITSPLAGSAS